MPQINDEGKHSFANTQKNPVYKVIIACQQR